LIVFRFYHWTGEEEGEIQTRKVRHKETHTLIS
jgi:hypothetical protein